MFVQKATNAGVRRPGYEAILAIGNEYHNILQKGIANCTSDWLGLFLASFPILH